MGAKTMMPNFKEEPVPPHPMRRLTDGLGGVFAPRRPWPWRNGRSLGLGEGAPRPAAKERGPAWFAGLGAILGLGSPLGLGLIRFFLYYRGSLVDWLIMEFFLLAWIYLYTGVGTVAAFSALGYGLGKRAERIGRRLAQAQREAEAVVQQSRTDALTGLYARGYLIERLEEEVKRSRRHHCAMACLFIDLDGLKALNETFGHLAGDAALKSVGAAIKATVRSTDICGRFGGDEFVVVLPFTWVVSGYAVAERIRLAVAARPLELSGQSVGISVSIGVHASVPDAINSEGYLRRADDALRESKLQGKNRTVLAN